MLCLNVAYVPGNTQSIDQAPGLKETLQFESDRVLAAFFLLKKVPDLITLSLSTCEQGQIRNIF